MPKSRFRLSLHACIDVKSATPYVVIANRFDASFKGFRMIALDDDIPPRLAPKLCNQVRNFTPLQSAFTLSVSEPSILRQSSLPRSPNEAEEPPSPWNHNSDLKQKLRIVYKISDPLNFWQPILQSEGFESCKKRFGHRGVSRYLTVNKGLFTPVQAEQLKSVLIERFPSGIGDLIVAGLKISIIDRATAEQAARSFPFKGVALEELMDRDEHQDPSLFDELVSLPSNMPRRLYGGHSYPVGDATVRRIGSSRNPHRSLR